MQAFAVSAIQAGEAPVVVQTLVNTVFVDVVARTQVAIKPYVLGTVGEVQATRIERQLAVKGDLRQTVIRRHIGDIGQFVGMQVQPRAVTVTTIGQGAALVDIGLLVDTQVGIEILEVVGIADVGVVDFGEQARVQPLLVLPAVHPALVFVAGLLFAFVFLVIQPGGADLAFAALGQVAELTFHQQAAFGHVGRVQRGVVVRRQVEVVRRLQREAVAARRADARRQEAGLATVVDREVDVRGVEHRNVLDPQRHVGGGAEASRRVQGDVVALQVPGVVARLATGIGAILEADDRGLFALGVERATAHVGLVHHVFGIVDTRFAVIQLQFGAVADHQHALVAQAYVTDQLATVFRLVQAGFVGLDLHAGLAQDDVTGEGGDLLFLLEARGLGGNVHRRLVQRRGVIHTRTQRLDVGACTVRASLGQLRGSQLIARDPVQVTVIGAARGEGAALAFGDQHRGSLLLGYRLAAGTTGADSITAVHRARGQGAGH